MLLSEKLKIKGGLETELSFALKSDSQNEAVFIVIGLLQSEEVVNSFFYACKNVLRKKRNKSFVIMDSKKCTSLFSSYTLLTI